MQAVWPRRVPLHRCRQQGSTQRSVFVFQSWLLCRHVWFWRSWWCRVAVPANGPLAQEHQGHCQDRDSQDEHKNPYEKHTSVLRWALGRHRVGGSGQACPSACLAGGRLQEAEWSGSPLAPEGDSGQTVLKKECKNKPYSKAKAAPGESWREAAPFQSPCGLRISQHPRGILERVRHCESQKV